MKCRPDIYPKPLNTPEDYRNFTIGNVYHREIQTLLRKSGAVEPLDIERSINSLNFPITSNTDIAKMWIDDRYYLVDLKTIVADPPKICTCPKCKIKFEAKPKTNSFEGIKQPLVKHRQQVILYLYFLNEELELKGEDPIQWGKVVYLRKDGGTYSVNPLKVNWYDDFPDIYNEYPEIFFTEQHRLSDIKEFNVEYNQVEAEKYVAKVAKLNDILYQNTIPIIDKDDLDPFYCKHFCNFSIYCQNK